LNEVANDPTLMSPTSKQCGRPFQPPRKQIDTRRFAESLREGSREMSPRQPGNCGHCRHVDLTRVAGVRYVAGTQQMTLRLRMCH
jgi:hypothetical protein